MANNNSSGKKAGAKKSNGFLKVVKTAGKVIKAANATAEAIKTIAGLFNDPNWYKYDGKIPQPAHNEFRPMGLIPANAWVSTQDKLNGIGIMNMVQVYIRETLNYDTEAFNLVTLKAFEQVRLHLRSNLPYNLEEFRQYFRESLAIVASLKVIERTLGWSRVVRADIPGLRDLISNTSVNKTVSGVHATRPIAMVSDDDAYAAAINRYESLRILVEGVVKAPKDMIEYYSWWMGSAFVDEDETNPQIYMNFPEYIVLYDGDHKPVQLELETLNLDRVYTLIESFAENYAVLLADLSNANIAKASGLSIYDFELKPLDTYTPILLQDKEYFNVLINAVTPKSAPYIDKMFKDGQYRMDFLPGTPDDTFVSAVHALGNWAGISMPLEIISTAIIGKSDSILVSQSTSVVGVGSTKVSVAQKAPSTVFAIVDDGTWIHSANINSVGPNQTQSIAGEGCSLTYGPNAVVGPVTASVDGPGLAGTTSITLSNKDAYWVVANLNEAGNDAPYFTPIAYVLLSIDDSLNRLYVARQHYKTAFTPGTGKFSMASDGDVDIGFVTPVRTGTGVVDYDATMFNVTAGNTSFVKTGTLPASAYPEIAVCSDRESNSFGTDAPFSRFVNVGAITTSMGTVPGTSWPGKLILVRLGPEPASARISQNAVTIAAEGGSNTRIAAMWSADATYIANPWYFYSVEITDTAPTVRVNLGLGSDLLHVVQANATYNIPTIYVDSMDVTVGNSTVNVSSTETLVKDSYLPVVFYKPDIRTVIYWMYAGLFSFTDGGGSSAPAETEG